MNLGFMAAICVSLKDQKAPNTVVTMRIEKGVDTDPHDNYESNSTVKPTNKAPHENLPNRE